MYIAIGFSSSSMSRSEKTMNFLLMSIFVGLLIKPAHVPVVYFVSFCASDSPPSRPDRTISKSDSSGGSIFLKSESAVISLSAYVSVIALSIIASSSGVSPPIMSLKSPTRFMMFERSTLALDSPSLGSGISKGLI